MRSRAAVTGALLLLFGCGVAPEDRPEPLTVSAPPAAEPSDQPQPQGLEVTVYFVQGADLAPVLRPTTGADVAAALEQLAAGPSKPEVLAGLRTALPAQSLALDEGQPEGPAAVAVTRDFTGVTGGNQLLAVAQVVWTLTELPGTTQVQFLVDGEPVEVPTDEGLTDEPVDRSDYLSVAPQPSSNAGTGAQTSSSSPTATD